MGSDVFRRDVLLKLLGETQINRTFSDISRDSVTKRYETDFLKCEAPLHILFGTKMAQRPFEIRRS